MIRATDEAFQFLVDEHGFRRVPSNDGFSYTSQSLIVEPSFNERDGFETDLCFPAHGAERVAVGTILEALQEPKPHEPEAHVMFISANLSRLAAVSPEVHRDLTALRFWHTGSWRKQWGTGISLDKAAIAAESKRLIRVREFFSGGGVRVA